MFNSFPVQFLIFIHINTLKIFLCRTSKARRFSAIAVAVVYKNWHQRAADVPDWWHMIWYQHFYCRLSHIFSLQKVHNICSGWNKKQPWWNPAALSCIVFQNLMPCLWHWYLQIPLGPVELPNHINNFLKKNTKRKKDTDKAWTICKIFYGLLKIWLSKSV